VGVDIKFQSLRIVLLLNVHPLWCNLRFLLCRTPLGTRSFGWTRRLAFGGSFWTTRKNFLRPCGGSEVRIYSSFFHGGFVFSLARRCFKLDFGLYLTWSLRFGHGYKIMRMRPGILWQLVSTLLLSTPKGNGFSCIFG